MKIFDTHVHTDFAYCADDDMSPARTTAIAREARYGICLVEHAGQLYVEEDDYWNGRFIEEPDIIYEQNHNRMDEYIEVTSGFVSKDVRIGIEVDVDKNGELTLRNEHKGSWDIVIGAVHQLPRRFADDIEGGFLWSVDALCQNGVDTLAHPFRYFLRNDLRVPTDLFAPTVQILKKYGVAAELNFHTNEPSKQFFEMCIAQGVKISVGSDAHSLHEVCDLSAHIGLLQSICGSEDLAEVLYRV